jgi:hypothetical protein
LLHIPAGYTIHCLGTYDNTADNPTNPNDPPQVMSWGESTTQEMYITFLQYVSYQPGDENISLPTVNEEQMMVYPKEQLFPCYPNPAFSEINIGFHLNTPRTLSLDILDMNGRVVETVFTQQRYGMGWHKQPIALSDLHDGQYLYRLHGDGFDESRPFVIQR